MPDHAAEGWVPEYLVIGNVTKDLLPDGGYSLGGTATYSAVAALRLGLHVGVLTSTSPDLALFPDVAQNGHRLSVQRLASEHATTFQNFYDASGRRQYVRAVAQVLRPEHLPSAWNKAPIVHLGPVAQEVSTELAEVFTHSLVGVTPQGWFRRWDAEGRVRFNEWPDAALVLERADVVVLSMEDLGNDPARLQRYIAMSRVLVLTTGLCGATVYSKGCATKVPAFAAREVDPTGAGDVFATGFLVRYRETGDPEEAAIFANCVASFVIEGPGTSTIPTRDQVEWRLRHGRLRADR
jgi:sugar/nucleoside kinase (ribokinase family)